MTRQWLSDPRLMCKQHILGEHLEAHIFVSKMQKETSLKGFRKGSMFFGAEFVKSRHDKIAKLLKQPHKTPLFIGELEIKNYPYIAPTLYDLTKSMEDLLGRCEECKRKHLDWRLYD